MSNGLFYSFCIKRIRKKATYIKYISTSTFDCLQIVAVVCGYVVRFNKHHPRFCEPLINFLEVWLLIHGAHSRRCRGRSRNVLRCNNTSPFRSKDASVFCVAKIVLSQFQNTTFNTCRIRDRRFNKHKMATMRGGGGRNMCNLQP